MPEIGIRELKRQASEIVRAIREEGAAYVVTLRGKPVAMLVPYGAPAAEAEPTPEEWMATLLEIGRHIAEELPEGRSVLGQLFDDREESALRAAPAGSREASDGA